EVHLRQSTAALAPDLVGAGFHVRQTTAVVGDQITVDYVVENRGGAGTGTGFDINFRLSTDNHFDSSDIDLGSQTIGTLAAGGSFQGSFTFTLPPVASGKMFVGMRIDAGDAVAELDETNNDSQRRSLDWDSFAVLDPVAESPSVNDSLDTAQQVA